MKKYLTTKIDDFGLPYTSEEWEDIVSREDLLKEVTTTANVAPYVIPLGMLSPAYYDKKKKKKKS